LKKEAAMKVGLSSYSLIQAINAKEMDLPGAVAWIKENGGEHVEIAYDIFDQPQMAETLKKKAKDVGIDISSYTIGAGFLQANKEDFEKEVARVKKQVDIAAAMGVKLMRHDAASRPPNECVIEQFDKDLPQIVDGCGKVADYAKQFGITTSVENHGYFMQARDRIRLLVKKVNRENFRTTLDAGNFMCVDEDPIAATKNNISIASHVHFKDFYFRPAHANPGEGWFPTLHGNFLRGSIVGQGDIDIRTVLKIIKDSGYNGCLSIEFEGLEECKMGSRAGMAFVKKALAEI